MFVNYIQSIEDLIVKSEYKKIDAISSSYYDLAKETEALWHMANALYHRASSHYYLSEYKQALFYAHNAVQIFEKSDDDAMTQATYLKIAACYKADHLYDEAFEYLFKAKTIETDSALNKIQVLNNLGDLQKEINDLEAAKNMYCKGLDLIEKDNKKHRKLHFELILSLSGILELQENYYEAIDWIFKIEILSKKAGDLLIYTKCCVQKGRCLFALANYKEAVHYFGIGDKIATENGYQIEAFDIFVLWSSLKIEMREISGLESALFEKYNFIKGLCPKSYKSILELLINFYNAKNDTDKKSHYLHELNTILE